MDAYLCLTVDLLLPVFHGQADGGLPEWPPSPLRAFQSLTAAAGARARLGVPWNRAVRVLEWLEQQPPPIVVVPRSARGRPRRMAVPNNDLDIVWRAWARRRKPPKPAAELKTLKTATSRHLRQSTAIHYLWRDEAPDSHDRLADLTELASAVTVLGWGIDLAVCRASLADEDAARTLSGERWVVDQGDRGVPLRVPVPGTLSALRARYASGLRRLDGGRLSPPPPLTEFRTVGYREESAFPVRPVAAFALLQVDGDRFRAFDVPRTALTVAGMARGATARAAEETGWARADIDRFVLGHAEGENASAHLPVGPRRFAYVPVPSLERRGEARQAYVGDVRRVLLCCFSGNGESELAWARRSLSGRPLVEQRTGRDAATLSALNSRDSMVRRFLDASSTWTTVTPVVLPGYDDPRHYRRRLARGVDAAEQRDLFARLASRTDALVRKGIAQSGFGEALARHAEVEWRQTGWLAGTSRASEYGVPDHLRRFPRCHVCIRWRDGQGRPLPVGGPVVIGAGRFYGLGLFAPL